MRKALSLVLFALFLTGVVLAVRFVTEAPGDREYRKLQWARSWRYVVVALGYPLPATPDLADLTGRLKAQGAALGDPVLIRIFKEEFELELWLLRDGQFRKFATYPICRWSGALGPKFKHGDHQAPEGFYVVGRAALNPNSRWHRSFNLGFPNLYDRSHGRAGSFLMVHGGCSSVGCYAMTNRVIDEIWRLVTAALDAGQEKFQVQSFPFRMTEVNLARHARHPASAFWRQLKVGSDLFESERLPPRAYICNKGYVFEKDTTKSGGVPMMTGGCPKRQQQALKALSVPN